MEPLIWLILGMATGYAFGFFRGVNAGVLDERNRIAEIRLLSDVEDRLNGSQE